MVRTDDGRVAHGADALVPRDNIQSRPNVHVFGLGEDADNPRGNQHRRSENNEWSWINPEPFTL